MPTHDMWCHNVTSYGKVDWRSSQRQHPAGSRVPRCPSQADAAARRAKSTRSRHFKPLAASSEPICVAKPQVTALRILAYSPKRKASAYFAYFLLASPSCGKRCATVCWQVARNTPSVYVPKSDQLANSAATLPVFLSSVVAGRQSYPPLEKVGGSMTTGDFISFISFLVDYTMLIIFIVMSRR